MNFLSYNYLFIVIIWNKGKSKLFEDTVYCIITCTNSYISHNVMSCMSLYNVWIIKYLLSIIWLSLVFETDIRSKTKTKSKVCNAHSKWLTLLHYSLVMPKCWLQARKDRAKRHIILNSLVSLKSSQTTTRSQFEILL